MVKRFWVRFSVKEADAQFQLLPLIAFRKASSFLAKLLRARDKRLHLRANLQGLVTSVGGKHTAQVPQRA